MKISFFSILLHLFGNILVDGALKASYGEVCSREKRCDSKALLTCSQEICQCLMPSTMVFDNGAKKCVALAGERCVFTTVEGDKSWTETVPCVSNAKCIDEICTCDLKYFEIANGSCEAKRDYEDSCILGNVEMCKVGLTCGDDGHCKCEDIRVYIEEQKGCVILAGGKCSGRINGGNECVVNASCKQVCTCESGYFQTLNGTCVKKLSYGQECLSDEMCSKNENLICGVDKRCKCVQGKGFDFSKKKCLTSAGGDCDGSGGESKTCVENSICHFAEVDEYDYSGESSTEGKCECNKGYFKNSDGRCLEKLDYGGACIDDINCKDTMKNGVKDVSTFMKCLKGTCDYPLESSVYSNSTLIPCLRLVGFSCSPNEDTCIPGAYCYKYYSTIMCTCSNGFYKTKQKTCSPKKVFGEACEDNTPCQEDLLLSCNFKKTCGCTAATALHPITKKCVNRAGKYCQNGNICVPNSDCTYQRGCVCHRDSTQTLDGYCYIKEDHPCDSDQFGNFGNHTKTCLPGLHCINDTCSCLHKNHQIYNTNQAKCVSLIKGPCEKSQDCVENSDCIDTDGIKQCQCKTGFTPVERQCDLAYGQQCHQGQSPLKCDRLAPLGCSEKGICECLDFQVYDNSTLTCRGLVGAKCDIFTKNFCGDGAVCKAFRSRIAIQGVCICETGMKPDADRKCKK